MRFIHTADWHLGNQMHEIDRHEESGAFLSWLLSELAERQADALIVSGDIFDTAHPSVEARKQYYDFLAAAVRSGVKNIVVIGGNHDSGVLLDASKELLGVSGVRVIGSLGALSPRDMVFPLFGRDGSPCAVCMAVPFVREVELRALVARDASDAVPDGDLYSLAYKALYASVYEEAEKLRDELLAAGALADGKRLPLIATGHLYAAELEGRLSDAKPNEKTDDGVKVLDVLGTLGNVPPSVLPVADYVALGHIHYTTQVAKNPRVRYSGSPFVLGFDEAELPRYVLACEIAYAGGELVVEKIPVPAAAVYRRLSGTISGLRAQLADFAVSQRTLSAAGQCLKPVYLELCYTKELGVQAPEELSDAVALLPPHVSVVSWRLLEDVRRLSQSRFEDIDAAELKNLDDKDIFTELILSKTGYAAESEEAKAALATYLPLFLQVASELEQDGGIL